MSAEIEAWAPRVGQERACRAFGVSPRTWRDRRQVAAGRQRARPSRAKPAEWHLPPPARIPDAERDEIARVLCEPRFADLAPAQVYATLLDEGTYLCSERQMYRVLHERGLVRERRRGHRRQGHNAPQVQATGPNQVWSWDIERHEALSDRPW